MGSWINNTIEYIKNKKSGSKHWGNHGVHIIDNIVYFSYFDTDVVVADNENRTLTIDDAGYSSGTTPGTIRTIMDIYEQQDYDVISVCDTKYDMWYNAHKYRITIFDYDVIEQYLKTNYGLNFNEDPVYQTIETIPPGLTPRQFRDRYFEQKSCGILLEKKPAHIWCNSNTWNGFCGMCYKFCNRKYNYVGTMMFQPEQRRLIKRTYLRRV
jgi:hypothetical protein